MSIKDKTKAVWGATPAGAAFGRGAEPGTKDFFENVLMQRASREMPWLYDIMPFSFFNNKKVLEIGCGAGYDAYEFCKHGAQYTGIDITPINIERTKQHLRYYDYAPVIVEGDAEHLQFSDNLFDVVYSNGVLHHTPDIERSFREVYRVLKTGGAFWVILYHKNSFFYWGRLFLFDHILRLGFRKRSFKERLSMIEHTTSDQLPLVTVYSRRNLKKLLQQAGFTVEKMWIRKLVKEDIPVCIPLPYVAEFIESLINMVPQRLLDFIGKRIGWYLIAKATKS